MKKICVRDCYDTSTSLYYYAGQKYDLEDGDIVAESHHFRNPREKQVVVEEKAQLDPTLKRKTVKWLAKKFPLAAKKVDLRTKGAHRSLVYEIMKEQGVIESVEEEGKTAGEHLIDEKSSKLEASRKR